MIKFALFSIFIQYTITKCTPYQVLINEKCVGIRLALKNIYRLRKLIIWMFNM